jgi:hypothetical protein
LKEKKQTAKLLKNTCDNPKNTQLPPHFQLCYPTDTTMKNEIPKTSRTDEHQGKSDLSSIERPGPYFSILSILVIPVGLKIASYFAELDRDGMGLGGAFRTLLTIAVSVMVGTIFATISVARNERPRALSVIVFLLYGIPIVFFFLRILGLF